MNRVKNQTMNLEKTFAMHVTKEYYLKEKTSTEIKKNGQKQ